MDTHIDWLSFTLPTEDEPRTAKALYFDAKHKLRSISNGLRDVIFNGEGFEPTSARAPYRVAIAREDNGSRIYGSSHTDTVLFELTGRGCEPIHKDEAGRDIIGGIYDRITRIDFAVDIVTGTSPTDFCNSREHNRFRSISFIRSASGETVYVGSAKSDRFCRVYRYNPPHPRSELLRVEFVFRRGLAKDAARLYAEEGEAETFVARLGNTYGFTGPDWRPGTRTDERIRVPTILKDDADTVHWLYSQVAPAMRRMVKVGALDMADFLDRVYNDPDASK